MKDQLTPLVKRNITDGHWAIDEFALSINIRSIGNPLIAVVQSRHCHNPEEMKANALLIAAAPDLLELAQNFLDLPAAIVRDEDIAVHKLLREKARKLINVDA